MGTTSLTRVSESGGHKAFIYLTALWHAATAVVCVVAALNVFQMPILMLAGREIDLGKPVQVFAGLLTLVPALMSALAAVMLLLYKNQGRYFSLMVNVVGFVLSLFVLLGRWGIYESYEYLVTGLMNNAWILPGFAVAYGLYWLSGRNGSEWLERLALALGGITLIVFLILSNILQGANYALSSYALRYSSECLARPKTLLAGEFFEFLTCLESGGVQSWLSTILVIVFLVMIFQVLKLSSSFGETNDQRTAWQGWLMLSPNIIGFILFFAGPLLLSFYLSFTNDTVGQVPGFVGLRNYADLVSVRFLTLPDETTLAQNALPFGYAVVREFNFFGTRVVWGAKDKLFWLSLWNTLLYCLMLLPLAIIPALGLSLVLNSKLPGVKFFRALYFLPSVAAVVGTALIWRWLYDPQVGFINHAINNIASWFGRGPYDIQWLSNPSIVLISVVIMAAWQVVGYNTVLFLAGLQGVPKELYEAARIDGANAWGQFRNVTLPLLAPTTFFVIITTMITGLQAFNEPYSLFVSEPIPENATTMVYYMYTQGFKEFQFGYASSIAWVVFFIIFIFTFIQFRANRNDAYN
jgi:ABC-type sugar transport system permease subunit